MVDSDQLNLNRNFINKEFRGYPNREVNIPQYHLLRDGGNNDTQGRID
jgi:hypothetical protein